MNFQVLVIFLLVGYVPAIYAENTELLEDSMSQVRSSAVSKIHPILVQWQASENPEEFAKKNNLSYKEDKVGAYIYLNNAESKSKIPSEIEVTAFNNKIVVTFVSSEQLDKLNELDFVERITPPDLARTPPIPQVEPKTESLLKTEAQEPETESQAEDQFDYLIWLVIGGIVLAVPVIILKMKKQQN